MSEPLIIASSHVSGFYLTPQTVTFTTNDPAAVIRYFINDTAGLDYTTPVVVSTSMKIAAVAIKGAVMSAPIHLTFTIDPVLDADGDGIPDSVEVGPDSQHPLDTDGDGTPDYLSQDSDSDGISDVVEGTADTNNDGIPNRLSLDSDGDGVGDYIEGTDDINSNNIPDYIDPSLPTALNVSFKGLPPSGEVVENIVYSFTVLVKSGTGSMVPRASTNIVLALGHDTTTALVKDLFVQYRIMFSGNRHTDTAMISFEFTDALSAPSDPKRLITREYKIVASNKDYPLMGNKITWKKNAAADFYRIYKRELGNKNLTILEDVPADQDKAYVTQWYLDRDESPLTSYSVSCVTMEGVEGPHSAPRHAPALNVASCLIQGSLADVGIDPACRYPIAIRLKEHPQAFGETLILRHSKLLQTDDRGYFEFYAPQGALIILFIDDAAFRRELLIPYEEGVDLAQLLALPQNKEL